MRPIERGLCPTVTDAAGNTLDVVFKEYGDAKPDLQDRLGKYCSYCEMALTNAACHVEHILAKDFAHYKSLITTWDNFLLSCQHCNSIKGTVDVAVINPYMPHQHNTFLLFDYIAGGSVKIVPALATTHPRATVLMNMVGLNRRPGHPAYSSKDDRWSNRLETWNIAERHLNKFQAGKSDIETIVHLALAKGFFSVWMAIFQAYPAIRQALINAFAGTATACFDAATQPINRNGTNI